jgi:hypothetical protein
MNTQLEIGYKGSRTYLHGSDIFNALAQVATTVSGDASAYVEQLIFRSFARNGCDVTTERPLGTDRLVGQATFRAPGIEESVSAWILETNRPVTERRPFDEANLLAKVVLNVEARSARLLEHSAYTPIEELIALTKQLNYAVCPKVNGKWVFGQLDLVEPLTGGYQKLEIHMKSLITGRFSVNDVFVDGRSIGTMRFIVGAP